MDYADMACAACWIAIVTELLSRLHVWMCTQHMQRQADEPARHASGQNVTCSTTKRWTQTSFRQAWYPPCDAPDQPEDFDSEVFMRYEVQSPQRHPLLSLSNTAGLCACGRSTCARKTNDSTLVEVKRKITRGRQPCRAKTQSSLILPEFSNYDAYAASTVDTAGTPRVYSADATRGEDYESETENAAVAERDTRLNRFHRF